MASTLNATEIVPLGGKWHFALSSLSHPSMVFEPRLAVMYNERMYVDLSVVINQQTPVYPGDAPVKIEPTGKIEQDGFNDHVVCINTHVGTHIDAPLHMIAGGKALDAAPVEQFVGRGVLVTVDKEFDMKAMEQAGVQAGDIVLFRTGMSERYHDSIYFENYSAMPTEMAEYLVEQRVKMVGVDTGSIDTLDSFPVHKILLTGNVLIIENLTNPDKLVGKEFKVYALPIKLTLDGAPARVIAEINEHQGGLPELQ